MFQQILLKMAQRYGAEVFNSTLALVLVHTVDRYPLYRMNPGPIIGEPSPVLLTCKDFYRSGRPFFFRTVYIDISFLAQYCRMIHDNPHWSIKRVDSLLPGVEKMFYDLVMNKTRIERVVLYGDSDLAHERRALWTSSGLHILIAAFSSTFQELCLNVNPVRNTMDFASMNILVALRIDFRSLFGDPMPEGPFSERTYREQQGWSLVEQCLTLESLRKLELEGLRFPDGLTARTFLTMDSRPARKRLHFLGLSLHHGHSEVVARSEARSSAFQTLFGRLLQSVDSLEQFFYEGSWFDTQIASSLVAALSYHKNSLQKVVISSSQDGLWFDDIELQYLREFTVLRELAVPIDFINNSVTAEFLDWDQNPLPPNLIKLQLQYGYIMMIDVGLHQVATEYMDGLLHKEAMPNVASALPSLRKVYWWRSQPSWDEDDLPEMEETTGLLEARIEYSRDVDDPAMARIKYQLIEGNVELRATPLGRQLKYWDPLPRREWVTRA